MTFNESMGSTYVKTAHIKISWNGGCVLRDVAVNKAIIVDGDTGSSDDGTATTDIEIGGTATQREQPHGHLQE